MNSQRFTNIQFQFGTTGFLLNIYLLSESLSLTPSIFVFFCFFAAETEQLSLASLPVTAGKGRIHACRPSIPTFGSLWKQLCPN